MRELQVAVWGLGPHAIKNIIPAITLCPGLKLYGVCSRNIETVSKIASEYICIGWNDSAEMLRDSRIDVVYLSTPIGLHYEQGKSILKALKHFWCEKPLAGKLSQVYELLDLSRNQNLTIAEGFMYLYHPHFLYLQNICQSGKLGRIKNINCRFGIPILDRPGFRNSPELGGGAFFDVGSYPVSAIVSLFPESDPVVVFSERKSTKKSTVDNFGCARLSISEETSIMLEWSTAVSYRNEIDIWGSNGSLFTTRIFSKPPDYVPYFKFSDLNGKESMEVGESSNHFLEMFKAFRDLVSDHKMSDKERLMILRRAELMNKLEIHNLYA